MHLHLPRLGVGKGQRAGPSPMSRPCVLGGRRPPPSPCTYPTVAGNVKAHQRGSPQSSRELQTGWETRREWGSGGWGLQPPLGWQALPTAHGGRELRSWETLCCPGQGKTTGFLPTLVSSLITSAKVGWVGVCRARFPLLSIIGAQLQSYFFLSCEIPHNKTQKSVFVL